MTRTVAKSLLVLLSIVAVCHCSRPSFFECVSSDECAKESCCVIGMGRYSIPRCEPRRDVGEICRPMSEPANTTLHYPDGNSVDFKNIYYIHSPCLAGLSCEEVGESTQCVQRLPSNLIFDYSEENNFEY